LLIVRLVEEDEKEVCADAAEALADSLNMYGIGILGDKVDFVYKGCLAIMEQKAPCQQDEEDRDEKEVADHDEVLMDHVTDLIAAMSKAIGPPFSKNYKKLHTALLKFTGPTHPQYDRSMSIGCFADVVEHLGNELSHFIPSLVQTMFAGLQDSSVAVRRNSAYLAGEFWHNVGRLHYHHKKPGCQPDRHCCAGQQPMNPVGQRTWFLMVVVQSPNIMPEFSSISHLCLASGKLVMMRILLLPAEITPAVQSQRCSWLPRKHLTFPLPRL